MIDRENYKDVREFLEFKLVTDQCDPKTAQTIWTRLRHLLEWADDRKLYNANRFKQTYPAYILEKVKSRHGEEIGAAQFGALCSSASAFFQWAVIQHKTRYKGIDAIWIRSIKPPRSKSEQSELGKREFFTEGEVIKLATAPVDTLAEKRTQAAVAFMFVSGMRIGAFCTLPINCVDIPNLKVYQLPEKGVMTKNHKAAITALLPIPELVKVIQEWDDLVRSKLPGVALWYPNLNSFGELTEEANKEIKNLSNRRYSLTDSLRALCVKVGVPYKSAHKFRHGFTVYAMKRAENMAQLKSISQNLMHSTIAITDGIYGVLASDDVHNAIVGLVDSQRKTAPATGQAITTGESQEELLARFAEVLLSKINTGQVK